MYNNALKIVLWLLLAVLACSWSVSAQTVRSVVPGDKVTVTAKFEGKYADQVMALRVRFNLVGPPKVGQEALKTYIDGTSSTKIGPDTLQVTITISDIDASGDWKLDWINGEAENGQIVFAYQAQDFLPARMITIQNDRTVPKPKVKITVQ